MFEKVYGFWNDLSNVVLADFEAGKAIVERSVGALQDPQGKKLNSVVQANLKDMQERAVARTNYALDLSKQAFGAFPGFKA